MPAENFQRGRVTGKEPGRENGKSGGDTPARVPPIKLDLRDLTDREELMIMEVIKRDERERAILDAKISEVRREIQELRKAGALVSGDDPAHMCARCKAKIAVGGAAKILPWVGGERAERCVVCKFLVCPKCRSRQAKGAWTCVLCLKYRQEKLLTGEVFNKTPKPEPMGSDLLRQSLRDRRGPEPDQFEDPEDYKYTQRPAKAREVDTESRCSVSSCYDQTPDDTAGSDVRCEKSVDKDEQSNANNNSSFDIEIGQRQHRAVHGSAFSSLTALDERVRDPMKGKGRHSPASSSPSRSVGRHSPGVSSLSADSVVIGSLGLGAVMRATSASGSSSPASSVSGRRSPATAADTVMFRGQPILPTHKLSSVSAPASLRHGAGGRSLSDSASDDAASLRSLDNESAPKRRGRTNSVSNPTVFYDDLKLSRQGLFLPSNSLPTSRSSSSLGSDYGNNPKYRTQKPPSARSELELFRDRGRRYSLKRKQALKDKDEEESGPASSTLVRPDGRRVSVCTPSNKWIVHWHELLRRRKSLEEMAKTKDQQNDQEENVSNSPILRVSPPTPSPASSIVKLDAQTSSPTRFDSDLTNTVFDLVRRKDGGRGSLPHSQDSLTPPGGHSRQDSASSVESISALVMAAHERQAVARLPSIELDELMLSGYEEIGSSVQGIPIPIVKRRYRPPIAKEGNISDSSDDLHKQEKRRHRRSGSRSPSPVSSRGSRPSTPASPHDSQPQSPALSRSLPSPYSSPSSRRSPGGKMILPNKMKLTSEGFRPMLAAKEEIRHTLEDIQNCPCGGLHPNSSPPSPILSPSPINDDSNPPRPSDLHRSHKMTPSLLRRDTSFMPPMPLPQIETPPLEKRILDLSSHEPPTISTPGLARAHTTGSSSAETSPQSEQPEKGRQGRRLLPAPGVVVAAKARAQAAADDDCDMKADSKETWRQDKVKTLPANRSASMSSQDGQPDRRPRRNSRTHTVGGHSVTIVSAKGKKYSSSSPASSSDEEKKDPRRAQSIRSLASETKSSNSKGEPYEKSREGRRDSCSSFVSYTAESVRSYSSPNIDGSSDESLSNHQVYHHKHAPITQNNGMKPASSQSSLNFRGRKADFHDTPPPPVAHSDGNVLKPASGDSISKPSPSFSSKFRFGRKNKTKETPESPTKDSNQKKLLNSGESKNSPKGSKGNVVADKNPELSAKRSNSFEEVYDSNVNRLLQTMKGSSTPNLERGKDEKPRWEDVKAKPGPTGKSSSFLSLNKELPEFDKRCLGSSDNLDWEGKHRGFYKGSEKGSSVCKIDNNIIAKVTSVEGLLSSGCHERAQQQLSGEEGQVASNLTDLQEASLHVEENHKKISNSTSIRFRLTDRNTGKHNFFTSSCENTEYEKIQAQPQTYFEQHALLLSRTPSREIPECLKSKLCRSDSNGSDALSVIQESSESECEETLMSSLGLDLTSVSSEDEESDDTLFGCVSDDSLSDDTKPTCLYKNTQVNAMDTKKAAEVCGAKMSLKYDNMPINCSLIYPDDKKSRRESVLLLFDETTNLKFENIKEKHDQEVKANENAVKENLITCPVSVLNKTNEAKKSGGIPDLKFQEIACTSVKDDRFQKESLLADPNPECDVLESSGPSVTNQTLGTDNLNDSVFGAGCDAIPRLDSQHSGLHPTSASPPLASSCSIGNSPSDVGRNNDVVDNAEAADVDGNDNSSSHTSAGPGGRKETLLQMALRAEKENRMLEREHAERIKEREQRKRLEAAESDGEDHDHLKLPNKSKRDPDNDSLTSGHLSISSRDEAGQSGGGLFSRLKTRARRKGYSQRKNFVTKPVKK